MENPGCVTFRDDRLFRGADDRRRAADPGPHHRARDGAHVVRRPRDHAVVGRPVAQRVLRRVHGDDRPWSTPPSSTRRGSRSAIVRKTWGYAAERRPSTHPVAGSPAPDAASALQDFDGISYAKGASVIRQLVAYLGEDAFAAGVAAYLREHAYGNGTFADLVGALERASGQDLRALVPTRGCARPTATASAWRRTSRRASIASAAAAPPGPAPAHPADRAHVVDVVGWTDGVEVVRRVMRTAEDVTACRSSSGSPAGGPGPQRVRPDLGRRRPRPRHGRRPAGAAVPDPRGAGAGGRLVGAGRRGVGGRDRSSPPYCGWSTSDGSSEASPLLLERLGGHRRAALRPRVPPREPSTMRPGRSSPMPAPPAGRLRRRLEPPGRHRGPDRRRVHRRRGPAASLARRRGRPLRPRAPTPTSAGCSLGNLARRGLLDPSTLDDAEERDPTFGGRLAALQARASRPTERDEGLGLEPGRRGELHAVQPPAGRAAAGFLVDAGRRPRAAVCQPLLRRGPAAVGMGRRRRAGPGGAVRLPPRGRAGDAAAGRGGSGRSGVVARDAPQHRGRRVRAQRGGGLTGAVCAGARRARRARLAVVGELQCGVEVLAAQHRLDRLEVVAGLAGHAQLVALDLRLDRLRTLVADDLGDLLGRLLVDALLEGDLEAVLLAREPRRRLLVLAAVVEVLERDLPLDQPGLEDVEDGQQRAPRCWP